MLLAPTKGDCPVCGAPNCTCKGENDVLVYGPIELPRRSDVGVVIAKDDIKVSVPGMPGTYQFLYRKGDIVRDEDVEALGLSQPTKPVPQDKAKRGPREAPKGPASRDKALTGPKEE